MKKTVMESGITKIICQAIDRLNSEAGECDKMVYETNRGGWSTHLVDPLTKMSMRLRQEAIGLSKMIDMINENRDQ